MVYVDPVTVASNPKVKIAKQASQAGKSFADLKVKDKKTTKVTTGKSNQLDAASMLLLQEVGNEGEQQRQQMQQYSNKSLAVLRKLQLQMLGGGLSLDDLHDMQSLLDSCPTPETHLQAKLLLDIQTRIAVEIAKIEVASNQK